MESKPAYTRPPETTEQDEVEYALLDEKVAEKVEEWLEKRDKELVQWVSLLAGGILVFASPLFLIELKKLNECWPFVVGIIGFFIVLLSLISGTTFYLTNIWASKDNPHYYFLKGGGKGEAVLVQYDLRLAAGRTTTTQPGVPKEEFDGRLQRHLRLVKASEAALGIHKVSFGIGVTLLIVSMVALVFKYKTS